MSELLQCQNYFSTRTTKIIARQYVLHEKGPGGFLGLTWVLKKNTNSAVSEILYTVLEQCQSTLIRRRSRHHIVVHIGRIEVDSRADLGMQYSEQLSSL